MLAANVGQLAATHIAVRLLACWLAGWLAEEASMLSVTKYLPANLSIWWQRLTKADRQTDATAAEACALLGLLLGRALDKHTLALLLFVCAYVQILPMCTFIYIFFFNFIYLVLFFLTSRWLLGFVFVFVIVFQQWFWNFIAELSGALQQHALLQLLIWCQFIRIEKICIAVFEK